MPGNPGQRQVLFSIYHMALGSTTHDVLLWCMCCETCLRKIRTYWVEKRNFDVPSRPTLNREAWGSNRVHKQSATFTVVSRLAGFMSRLYYRPITPGNVM
jgi:hypothetical protein